MSKTYKDEPFEVKAKRLGASKKSDDCAICNGTGDDNKKVVVSGFNAIFYAHEQKEIEALTVHAEELGYTVETAEQRAYLGKTLPLSYNYAFSQKFPFDELFDEKRALYSAPRGVAKNLLWNRDNDPNSDTNIGVHRYSFGYTEDTFPIVAHVAKKDNIFVIVSVSKETTVNTYHGMHCEAYYPPELSDHCRCGWCEPDEGKAKNNFRKVAVEVRNSFNSGELDSIEDLSENLTTQGSNAYRDWMKC